MSSASEHDYEQLLDRIVAAAESGDPSDFFAVYADDAVIWHNHDDREQTVAENAAQLAVLHAHVSDLRYTERRMHTTDGVIVQQHVLRGTRTSTGEPVAMHACVVAHVNAHGRISRLDEYLDSRAAGRLLAP